MTTAGRLVEIRPGVWKGRVYVGTIDGREVVRSRTFPAKTRRAAERRYDEIAVALRGEGTTRKERGQYVAGLVDEWFEIKQSKCSPTTIARIRPIVQRIKDRLGRLRVDEIDARDIERFYAWLRTTKFGRGRNLTEKRHLTESTVHHHHRVLASILNTGERWGRAPAIVRRVEHPSRGTAKVNPPTREQIAAVVDFCPDTWGPVFGFAAVSGMRRGELCAARWIDLTPAGLLVTGAIVKDGDRLIRKTTKTDKPRTVELGPYPRALLAGVRTRLEAAAAAGGKKLAATAYLFPDFADLTGRTPLHPDHLSQAWRHYAKKAGVAARFHDLRHYAATYYLSQGIAVNDVAHMLGHAQPSTTVNVYGHASRRSGIAAVQSGVMLGLPTGSVSS